MMCCQQCPLVRDKLHPNSLQNRFGEELDPIFACPHALCTAFVPDSVHDDANCGGCPKGQHLSLCRHDAYVLTHLPGSAFAQETAHFCLDTLVTIGRGDLLCELFQIASYDLRQELWDRMICLYNDRRYLLDPLFEKYDVPADTEIDPWVKDWYPIFEHYPEFAA